VSRARFVTCNFFPGARRVERNSRPLPLPLPARRPPLDTARYSCTLARKACALHRAGPHENILAKIVAPGGPELPQGRTWVRTHHQSGANALHWISAGRQRPGIWGQPDRSQRNSWRNFFCQGSAALRNTSERPVRRSKRFLGRKRPFAHAGRLLNSLDLLSTSRGCLFSACLQNH